ncbi:MAG: hypothetical protein ACOZFS_02915 [Thermodesulfobacteriota bacterium]
MKDHEVVEAFVAHLAANGYPGLCVDKWPERENRKSPDIEAIAGQFAIEHTSIDTLPNQRGKSHWFMRAAGELEKELPKLPYRLNITLEYDAITKGQDWGAIRETLKTWVIENCPQLPDGRYTLENLPGIPFQLRVKKQTDRPPRIIFGRIAPEDKSLPGRISQQLDSKIKKLEPYQEGGFITVLLIESEDIALMNEVKMLDAIRNAYPGGLPPSVGEIWYVDTSIPSEIEFRDFTELVK